MPRDDAPIGHPCVTSDCGHGETEHVPTPELAAPSEVVVWCVACRKHEVLRPRRWRLPWSRPEPVRMRSRFSRPG